MNPKLKDVRAAVEALPRKSESWIKIVGSSITLPDQEGFADHIQGIAPVNGSETLAGCVAGSSTDGAWISTFSEERPTYGSIQAVQVVADRPKDYDHGSGVQLLDRVLPVGIESDRKGDPAIVRFYDLTNLAAPRHLYDLVMQGDKASATAITNVCVNGKEHALLAVYTWDPMRLVFYLANYDHVTGSESPFKYRYENTQTVLEGGDQYQNFALVTDKSDTVWLLGFREDEELHLFQLLVELQETSLHVKINKAATYTGWDGTDWARGVGVQIVNDTRIRLFGTATDANDLSYYVKIWPEPSSRA